MKKKTEIKMIKIKLKNEDNEDKNNHSLRFDKYVDRKIIKTEINPNVSYINQYDYQKARNNSIDFSKMHGRDDDMFCKDENKKCVINAEKKKIVLDNANFIGKRDLLKNVRNAKKMELVL